MKGICSVCHQEFEDGQEAIFGIKVGGQWRFGSSHKPVGDVDVLLASAYCAARWVSYHPECENAILDLLAEGEHQRREQLEKFFECVRHQIRWKLRRREYGGKDETALEWPIEYRQFNPESSPPCSLLRHDSAD